LKYRFEFQIEELIPPAVRAEPEPMAVLRTMRIKETLLKNSRNKEYVWKHLRNYSELLYNDFHEKTRFAKNPKLIMERFDVFDFVIQMIKNGEIDKLYDSIKPLSKEYDELVKNLYELESQLFRTCC
jgi:hypothetical protein